MNTHESCRIHTLNESLQWSGKLKIDKPPSFTIRVVWAAHRAHALIHQAPAFTHTNAMPHTTQIYTCYAIYIHIHIYMYTPARNETKSEEWSAGTASLPSQPLCIAAVASAVAHRPPPISKQLHVHINVVWCYICIALYAGYTLRPAYRYARTHIIYTGSTASLASNIYY